MFVASSNPPRMRRNRQTLCRPPARFGAASFLVSRPFFAFSILLCLTIVSSAQQVKSGA
jgi:hypothetical protein